MAYSGPKGGEEMTNLKLGRRRLLKTMGAGLTAAVASPLVFTNRAHAQAFCNNPGDKDPIFGFNVPQTGTYAEEGLEQLKGYELAVKHINGEGDGGLMNTMKPMALKGNGILGRKLQYGPATPRPTPTPPAMAPGA